MVNECIFCQITAGKFGTEMLYEDDILAVFKDIQPQAPIHYLIVPKRHYANILAMANSPVAEFKTHFWQVLPAIIAKAGLANDGFRLLTNCGKDAGQTVEHLHFHLLGGDVLSLNLG